MLTLFHHSLPPWAAEYGGWKLEKTVDYFMEFTRFILFKSFNCGFMACPLVFVSALTTLELLSLIL